MMKRTAESLLKGNEMKKKPSDIQKLKRQIEMCLRDGLRLAFSLPNQEIRNPTWDEFKDGVTEGYAGGPFHHSGLPTRTVRGVWGIGSGNTGYGGVIQDLRCVLGKLAL